MFRRITFKEVLERYLRDVAPSKRGGVIEEYQLRRLRRHPIVGLPVGKLKPADLGAYRDQRLREVSAGTVRRELGIVSVALEIARREWGLIETNPARDVRFPPSPRPRTRRLEARHREGDRLLAACAASHEPLLLPVVEFAIETAMRRGEILSLVWEHVDLARRTAMLPETKNGHLRVVPLSSRAVEVLEELPPQTAGPVFPLTVPTLKRQFARAVKLAGLEDFRFHDLRHEATTRLFEKGLAMMEVASITGHRDPRKLRGYTHLAAEALAKKLD
ncbi:MAG: site-specific integrase [Gammaproteobacteria bacterium]